MVNGNSVEGIVNNEFLLIPKVYLNVGLNTVAVYYTNNFNNDGFGCMSYFDIT